MITAFNGLTDEEAERLFYLAEELSESIQAVQKILRHGYESFNPSIENSLTNREHLEEELGQTILAMTLLVKSFDLSEDNIEFSYAEKVKTISKWMHHQPQELLKGL